MIESSAALYPRGKILRSLLEEIYIGFFGNDNKKCND